MCDCWKDKIYYWVKFNDECVYFIAITGPDDKCERAVYSAQLDYILRNSFSYLIAREKNLVKK